MPPKLLHARPVLALFGLLLALASAAVQALPAETLPEPVRAALAAHKLEASGLSVFVAPAEGGTPLVSWLAEQPRNPASSVKVVTTLAALELLGPEFTWPLEVWLAGELDAQGRLAGPLVLKGQGSPKFTDLDLLKLVRALRDRGLTEIQGGLLLDNSYFLPASADPDAFDGQGHRVYNTPPDALLYNQRATRFSFRPDRARGRVEVQLDPPSEALGVVNQLKLARGERCTAAMQAPRFDLRVMEGRTEVVLSGEVSDRCEAFERYWVIEDPHELLYQAFRRYWGEAGGSLKGGWRLGATPATASRFYVQASAPVAEIIRDVNRWSSNPMARSLLLTIGARSEGAPGTEAKGALAVSAWLRRQGVNSDAFQIDNGSGLSRDCRVTAHGLAEVLRIGWQSPWQPEFLASLPVAGLSGTARKRQKDAPEGSIRIKTGTLNNVRAMAGYVRSEQGHVWRVVTLHNAPGVQFGTGTAVQDALLDWLLER